MNSVCHRFIVFKIICIYRAEYPAEQFDIQCWHLTVFQILQNQLDIPDIRYFWISGPSKRKMLIFIQKIISDNQHKKIQLKIFVFETTSVQKSKYTCLYKQLRQMYCIVNAYKYIKRQIVFMNGSLYMFRRKSLICVLLSK